MKLLKLYQRSEFLKSVVVLTTGTVMAQAVGYLVMPFLTHLYTDEQWGDWGLYTRIVAFVSTVATARYELSIPLPKHDGHSYALYKLSLYISRIILLLSVLLAVAYLLIEPSGWNDIWFVIATIVSIFFVVYINLGTNWAIRTKAFKKISFQQMTNSISANGFRLLFGWMNFGSLGMVLGTTIGYAVSSFGFVKDFLHLDKVKYKNYTKKKQRALLREYREFPTVNLPHVTVDLGRDLLVAAFIAHYFGKGIFGQFNHSYLILKLPLVVVGVAIGRVFYQRCVELVNDRKSTLPLLRRTLGTLFLLSIIPFSIIFMFGEPMFAFVFGEEWGNSGYYSEIMAIWSLMLFLVSPLSSLPLALRRQKEFFILGLFGSVIQLFSFGVLPMLWGTSDEAWIGILWFVSIAQSCYFLVVCIFTLYYAGKGVKST